MIRVMVVDDQEMIRIGLRAIVDANEDFRVVAEAPDGSAAVRTVRTTAIDVVLMDLRMPGVDGVEATRRIRAENEGPTPRILVLTTFDQDENVLAALRAGADGFLSKGVGPDELAEAIRNVAVGGNALSPTAVAALVGHAAASDVLIVFGRRRILPPPRRLHADSLQRQWTSGAASLLAVWNAGGLQLSGDGDDGRGEPHRHLRVRTHSVLRAGTDGRRQ